MTRYLVPGFSEGRDVHDEVAWAIDRDDHEIVISKITRTYPVSGRGVERKHPPKVKTESMAIPDHQFSNLIKSVLDSLMSTIGDLEMPDWS